MATVNLALFLWPVAAKYRYREFAPPKAADAVAVGLGRSVAGPAPTGQGSKYGTPIGRTLSRANTIHPYASGGAISARLARAAASRQASFALSGDGGGGGARGRAPSAGAARASAAAERAASANSALSASGGTHSAVGDGLLARISEAPPGESSVVARARGGSPPPPRVDERGDE